MERVYIKRVSSILEDINVEFLCSYKEHEVITRQQPGETVLTLYYDTLLKNGEAGR